MWKRLRQNSRPKILKFPNLQRKGPTDRLAAFYPENIDRRKGRNAVSSKTIKQNFLLITIDFHSS